MEKSGINMGRVATKLGVLLMAGMALVMSGCAIHSVDENGNPCVVNQTCPGLFVTKANNEVYEGMNVIGVHKEGSEVWNNAILADSRTLKISQDEVRKQVAGRDFVQVRKMGFMFAINKHGGLFASGLKVGDVVDIEIGPVVSIDQNKVLRIVKRAGE